MTDIEKVREALKPVWALLQAADLYIPTELYSPARNGVEDIEASLDHLAARVGEFKEPVRWRHARRGTYYEEIGEVVLQTGDLIGDCTNLVLYRDRDGNLWARPAAEFHDGRFERVVPLPPPPETNDE